MDDRREEFCRNYHAMKRKSYNDKKQRGGDGDFYLMLGFEAGLSLSGFSQLSDELAKLREDECPV